MSHELLIDDGEASMMYVGEPPWHGLGTRLNSPATAEEAIFAARLGWEVEKKPLSFMDGANPVLVEDRYAVVPGDGWQGETRPVLGIVSKGYTPLQNRDAQTDKKLCHLRCQGGTTADRNTQTATQPFAHLTGNHTL